MLLITTFLEKLNSAGVNYVHWKSNTNINLALSGIDDLDILVDPVNEVVLQQVFTELKFIRAFSDKDKWQNGITHFIGLDIESQKLVHVHLHFKLSLGYDYDKCFTLPIVESYLENRTNYQGKVFLPTYENEYCILIIRLILKNALTPFLLCLPYRQFLLFKNANSKGVLQGGGYSEFLDLKEKINLTKLNETLGTNFSFVPKNVFEYCESVLLANDSVTSYFKAGKKLKKELKNYRDYGEFRSFCKAFLRLYSIRFYAVLNKLKLYNKITGKKAENGGRIIAFIGGDGAGKTTTISNLKNTLKKQFALKSIHVGKPGMTFLGLVLRVLSKFLSILKVKNYSRVLYLLAIAVNRRLAFKKACKLRDKGFIVLQDRIPLEGITAMDCPRIHTLLGGKFKRLSKLEKKIYSAIKGVDMLFVMKLNPEIALQRRPEDDPDELRIRSGQIWNNNWVAPYGFVINTGENNPEEVQKILLKEVWKQFNKPFVRAEIIGLNGTGKSTLFKKINDKIPNTQQNINVKQYPWLFLLTAIKIIIPTLRIYLKSKNKNITQNYFHFRVSLSIIKKWKKRPNYSGRNLIFDQGPYFQAALLYKEKCINKIDFVKYINYLQDFIPSVVTLSASKEVLFKRVNLRKDSNGRGQFMNFEEFSSFCSEYKKSYKLVKKNTLRHEKINTSNNSLKKTFKLFKKSVYAK